MAPLSSGSAVNFLNNLLANAYKSTSQLSRGAGQVYNAADRAVGGVLPGGAPVNRAALVRPVMRAADQAYRAGGNAVSNLSSTADALVRTADRTYRGATAAVARNPLGQAVDQLYRAGASATANLPATADQLMRTGDVMYRNAASALNQTGAGLDRNLHPVLDAVNNIPAFTNALGPRVLDNLSEAQKLISPVVSAANNAKAEVSDRLAQALTGIDRFSSQVGAATAAGMGPRAGSVAGDPTISPMYRAISDIPTVKLFNTAMRSAQNEYLNSIPDKGAIPIPGVNAEVESWLSLAKHAAGPLGMPFRIQRSDEVRDKLQEQITQGTLNKDGSYTFNTLSPNWKKDKFESNLQGQGILGRFNAEQQGDTLVTRDRYDTQNTRWHLDKMMQAYNEGALGSAGQEALLAAIAAADQKLGWANAYPAGTEQVVAQFPSYPSAAD